MTIAALEAKKPWKRKYRNQPVIDKEHGRFDSKREHQRFLQLRLLERAGEISGLQRQVPYDLVVNDQHVCKYIADFTYMDNRPGHGFTTEDAKGVRTPEYKIKAALFKAIFGREILET